MGRGYQTVQRIIVMKIMNAVHGPSLGAPEAFTRRISVMRVATCISPDERAFP
jgi:hypothetical protein